MSATKNKPPLGLDMDFGEALERFANVDPNEIEGDIKIKKKRGRKPRSKVSKKPS